MWQFGGPYIPGTTNKFGSSAEADFGALLGVKYPTAPFGDITIRDNDFRSIHNTIPCQPTKR